MFVAIDNKDKHPVELEGLIQRTRNDGKITPEFAMDILSLTNFRTNIKKLVRAIKDKCKTKEDILPYRELIVSCVEEREVSEEALADLQEMAILCGCVDEFNEANGKPKFYGKFDCNNTLVVKSREEFEALKEENLKVYFDADDVDLSYLDLSKIGNIKFREGAEVKFVMSKNLPKCLDVSVCSVVALSHCDLEGLNLKFREGAEVNLFSAKNLPKDLDISQCSIVNLRFCDLEGLNLKFRERAEVNLYRARNLPKVLDLSMCSYVSLAYCYVEGLNLKFKEGAEVDLSHVENLPKDLDVSIFSMVDLGFLDLSKIGNIKFREGSKVHLSCAKNLPKDLDVSMCSYVNLHGCDLERLNLKFREGAEVGLSGAKNLPKDLDVSMCSSVSLRDCDLEGLNLKFREGAEVVLYDAYNLPRVLDLSMCSKVELKKCDLTGVEKIKFKDKDQELKFMEGYRNFEGKIVYSDEDKKEKENETLFSRIRKRFGAGGIGE